MTSTPNGKFKEVYKQTGYGLDGPGIESRWGERFSAPVETGPGANPASCTMGTGSFPGVKSGRSVTLTHLPLLVPWSWKGRVIPLLPLCAVRPVQNLNACTRVHFTFTFINKLANQIVPPLHIDSFTLIFPVIWRISIKVPDYSSSPLNHSVNIHKLTFYIVIDEKRANARVCSQ